MSESSADCVIVGGGIGGAILALILGRQKKHVVILEREEKPVPQPRPELHAHGTIELFRKLGVADRILREAALPLEGLNLRRPGGDPLVQFTSADFKRFEVQPYSTDPAKVRAILIDEAKATGCVEIRHGVNVRELVFHGMQAQGVRALDQNNLVTWRAPLTVGDDGGHSRIRRSLAIPIHLKDFPIDFLGQAGTEFHLAENESGNAWVDPARFNHAIMACLCMPQPGGRASLLFIMSPAVRTKYIESVPSPQFAEDAIRLCPLCKKLPPEMLRPDRFTTFHRFFGHAKRYVGPGAAIIGDAAHPVTPAGGQGANMSIADAVKLAEVALEAYTNNDFSTDALRPYDLERRPANERSLQFSVRSKRIFRVLRWAPFLGPWLVSYLEGVGRDEKRKREFIQSVSHAFESHASDSAPKLEKVFF